MPEKLFFFPIFPKELLTDEKVMRLTERQGWRLIKLWCFHSLHGHLPADPRELAKFLGLEWRRFKADWGVLREFFVEREIRQSDVNLTSICPPNCSRKVLVSLRLEKEAARIQRDIDQKREAGRKGAKSRWGDRHPEEQSTPLVKVDNMAAPLAEPLATPLAPDCHSYSDSERSDLDPSYLHISTTPLPSTKAPNGAGGGGGKKKTEIDRLWEAVQDNRKEAGLLAEQNRPRNWPAWAAAKLKADGLGAILQAHQNFLQSKSIREKNYPTRMFMRPEFYDSRISKRHESAAEKPQQAGAESSDPETRKAFELAEQEGISPLKASRILELMKTDGLSLKQAREVAEIQLQ